MSSFYIYTAGGMSNLSFEEYNGWRQYIKKAVKVNLRDATIPYCSSRLYDVQIVNPADYFNFEEKRHKTDKEVMDFDLYKLLNSNLVIVNFNDPQSLGTMAELGIAYDHKIPILGLNELGKKLHPWQEAMCNRIFDNMPELLEYLTEMYLN